MGVVTALLVAATVAVWPGPGALLPLVAPRPEPSPAAAIGRWRRGPGARGGSAGALDVLALVDVVAPALRAGLTPAAALRLAAGPGTGRQGSSSPGAALADRLARAAEQGEPLASLWAQAAGGAPELDLLARAWALSEETGAPLADAAATVGALVRHRLATQRRLEVAVAGARATMNLLTLLPLAGPLAALALGVGPRQLFGGPAAQTCLVAGLGLALVGRLWVRRIVAAVTRSEAVT